MPSTVCGERADPPARGGLLLPVTLRLLLSLDIVRGRDCCCCWGVTPPPPPLGNSPPAGINSRGEDEKVLLPPIIGPGDECARSRRACKPNNPS